MLYPFCHILFRLKNKNSDIMLNVKTGFNKI